jgi:formate dehydrogenase major subunit
MGRKALEPPGDAKPDWWITIEIAKRMGLTWTYESPADVFAEMKRAMPSLDNISWERLAAQSAVTYPCPAPDHPGEDIVFADRFPTADGLGKFVAAEVIQPDELPDRDYPYILSTGRQLEHWHTGAMTRRAASLDALEPAPTAQLNPATIARLGIKPGDMVRVTSRRGMVELQARADGAVPENVVFIPFAYVEAAANLLTNPKLDPFGKIPEYKFCAVKVEAVKSRKLAAAE